MRSENQVAPVSVEPISNATVSEPTNSYKDDSGNYYYPQENRWVLPDEYAKMEIEEQTLKEHTSKVNAVAFLPNGRISVSGGRDNSLVMTDLVTKEVICRKENAHEEEVSKIAVSPDGIFIVTCDIGRKILKMWDPNDNLKELAELNGHDGNVYSVAVHPNSKLIASGDYKGKVKLWEPAESGGS